MKQVSNQAKIKASKGNRLKWTALKEVPSVKISSELTQGKHLTSNDLANVRKPNSNAENFIIP